MTRGLTHIVVAYIGLAIVFIGIFYSDLQVPGIFISCATLSALFFTIVDFFSLFDNKMNLEIEKKDSFSDRITKKMINKLIEKRRDVIQICLLFAIFSIIFIPYIPNINSFLTEDSNNKITLVSLGLVIFIISFRQIKTEAEYEKELKRNIEELTSITAEYKEWSKSGMAALEESQDKNEKLLEHIKELNKKLEKYQSR
ncbi:hypothetical protein FZC78_19220 [Rossellomorea vietnamensis]|uniref:Uncharacterized protein n=1 Tax=Rossellomorea vietnamensis TaxID=218284 RepID=A0A5D4NLL9_9BACI|nr:hypothetical protein [Rossellomorea vietnamensis]TYS14286.1 hypothetical protein FZC78_19220 [Rossellomorea vietnamensis]